MDGLKLVPTKLIRKIAPEILSRTNELKRLCRWRRKLTGKQEKVERLHLDVLQMQRGLMAEEKEWAAEAARIANRPFDKADEVIGIAAATGKA